ncbi:hypothetical protein CGLO_17261 [Colletotrichum gloeosporioides Cg-14]|uniref:Uncharacterized protein n=1 Tax=Colletotrichum gloeosporioides (strain Cg-14) TaxID=1237896 RepID=T0L723_COLGC|nr:hypothetical protein CGLO_17261 [Colletotrichum gloeosporioides Cg-14]
MSGSSSSGRSQTGPKPRNVLRRKKSSVAQKTPSLSHGSTDSTRTSSSSSAPRSRSSLDPGMQLDRGITESPTEIRIAHVVDLPKTQAQPVTIYPELDRYRDYAYTGRPSTSSEGSSVDFLHRLATHDLPPPTPVFSGTSSQLSAFSGSPSTRFSESPGPGPYSRDTTPTSMSSQSPGLVIPMRTPAPRTRQLSPAVTRPPVTRRRAGSANEMDAFSATQSRRRPRVSYILVVKLHREGGRAEIVRKEEEAVAPAPEPAAPQVVAEVHPESRQ